MEKQWLPLFFWAPKITADGDCSHEIKRCLLLGRKATTNLDSILKSRDITLQTNVRLVKAMVFLVVMYGYENWTVKKAEGRRIDAFELWCWRRLLRVPWNTKRSNQSILKEISPGCSLEDWCQSWKFNTFTTWCEELTHLQRPWCWEDWKQEEKGKTEDEMVRWYHWLNRCDSEWTPGVGDGQGGLACWGSWGRKESDTTERLNWTELLSAICKPSSDNHFAFLYSFFLGIVLIPVSCTMSETSIHSSSGTLSIRSNPFESISHFHCIIVRDLI